MTKEHRDDNVQRGGRCDDGAKASKLGFGRHDRHQRAGARKRAARRTRQQCGQYASGDADDDEQQCVDPAGTSQLTVGLDALATWTGNTTFTGTVDGAGH